jgi:hypothetical protein
MLKEERKGLTSRKRPIYIRNLTPQGDSPTSIKNLTLQGDSRNFRKVKEEKRISPLINVTIVTRWDILLRIVQLEEKNTIREITKDIMPMELKMMSHPRN